MRFCISITEPNALKRWISIPKQRRSRFIEAALLNQVLPSIPSTSEATKKIDISVIDELYDL